VISGDTIAQVVYLQSTAGAGYSYANKAAFQAALWDLTWTDATGVALTTQPTWSIAVEAGSTNGKHLVTYTVPPGFAVAKVTVPSGASDPGAWASDGSSYDEDALAGLFLTSTGVPSPTSASDQDLGDVVAGDAYNSGTLYIPLGRLTAFGYAYSDLASGWTISAGLKAVPTDTSVAITAAFGASVATDGAFKVSWSSYPAGLALTTEQSKQFYMDVQLKRTASSTLITTNRYALRAVWDRNTAT
jgi:hypothetical protein